MASWEAPSDTNDDPPKPNGGGIFVSIPDTRNNPDAPYSLSMSTSVTIRRVSYSEILSAPNAQELINEYAAECSVPGAEPQEDMYEAMEDCGAFRCFGAFVGDDLIGFISTLTSRMPHNGKRMANVESVFVMEAHRPTGAGNALLATVEDDASDSGCDAVTCMPRIGSILEIVLLRRSGWSPTHTQFTRWLQ